MFSPLRLIASLNFYNVHFLVGEDVPGFIKPLAPAELLAGLTVQWDARLRLALIAALLQRPEFAANVDEVLDLLPLEQRPIFQLYYTAAVYLQTTYANPLRTSLGQFGELPDLYSAQLGISPQVPSTEKLKQLAHRHQEITRLSINWYGTYHHAARRVIQRLEKEQQWQIA
jgi:hypothetical protein